MEAIGGRPAHERQHRHPGHDAALAGKIYDYYRSVGMWPRPSRPITRGQYDRTVAFFRQTGQLESSVPFQRVWNLSYWKAG